MVPLEIIAALGRSNFLVLFTRKNVEYVCVCVGGGCVASGGREEGENSRQADPLGLCTKIIFHL